MGLSPYVRGKLKQCKFFLDIFGSIPVCTGETRIRILPCSRNGVYPRMYGGNNPSSAARDLFPGLSPYVRGKLLARYIVHQERRSIPVCTGETVSSIPIPFLIQVYPRMYGGNLPNFETRFFVQGLSPYVRGKRNTLRHLGRYSRSIPVCTGETDFPPEPSCEQWVYPRMYGGNTASRRTAVLTTGLSPYVRGKPHLLATLPTRVGSIPVCTGETLVNALLMLLDGVYPRMYGGNAVRVLLVIVLRGLSPYVRGKLLHGTTGENSFWSIPVCTGETFS